MSRARNIKPGFFKNEDLASLPFEARLLFIGLWSLADREGRLVDRPRRIKAELFPYDEIDVDKLIQYLADSQGEFINRYEVDGIPYIAITNWHRHQTPHYREPPSEIPSEPTVKSRVKRERAVIDQSSVNDAGIIDRSLADDSAMIDVSSPGRPESSRADTGYRIPDTGYLIPDSGLLIADSRPSAVDQAISKPAVWETPTVEVIPVAVGSNTQLARAAPVLMRKTGRGWIEERFDTLWQLHPGRSQHDFCLEEFRGILQGAINAALCAAQVEQSALGWANYWRKSGRHPTGLMRWLQSGDWMQEPPEVVSGNNTNEGKNKRAVGMMLERMARERREGET